jgi:chromosome transmission fidelity protein 4
MALINSAHDPGFACLAFSRDGSSVFLHFYSWDVLTDILCSILYTGGSDCLVRIWNASGGTDQEPSIAIESDQPVTCVAATVSQINILCPLHPYFSLRMMVGYLEVLIHT